MRATVTDENGVRHDTCHGVPVLDWLKHVSLARSKLGNGEWGVKRVTSGMKCQDPDCRRLNRGDSPVATFRLMQEVEPVKPISDDVKERTICDGHPYLRGSYLCHNCAAVAFAKRLIQAKEKRDEH